MTPLMSLAAAQTAKDLKVRNCIALKIPRVS
jgi:hypothetical protein